MGIGDFDYSIYNDEENEEPDTQTENKGDIWASIPIDETYSHNPTNLIDNSLEDLGLLTQEEIENYDNRNFPIYIKKTPVKPDYSMAITWVLGIVFVAGVIISVIGAHGIEACEDDKFSQYMKTFTTVYGASIAILAFLGILVYLSELSNSSIHIIRGVILGFLVANTFFCVTMIGSLINQTCYSTDANMPPSSHKNKKQKSKSYIISTIVVSVIMYVVAIGIMYYT